MSLLSEQQRALKYTNTLLFDLCDPKATPKVPRKIRQRASDCLRHFPHLNHDGKPLFSKY